MINMAGNKSSEVIGGKRYCGKTTELIKRASKDNLYILCANRNMAQAVANRAEEMKVDIPFPITVSELPLQGYNIDEILIDEVEMVLQQLIGKRVVGMSTSYKLRDMPMINNKEPNRPEPPKPVTSKSIGSLHVDIDCSDALKGLK